MVECDEESWKEWVKLFGERLIYAWARAVLNVETHSSSRAIILLSEIRLLGE